MGEYFCEVKHGSRFYINASNKFEAWEKSCKEYGFDSIKAIWWRENAHSDLKIVLKG